MKTEQKISHLNASNSQGLSRQILVIAALVSTVFGFLYFTGLMGRFIINGTIHAVSSPGISMISAAVGLLWDITLVILFAALKNQLVGRKVFFAELGFIFMVLLAATSGINWYVQLTLIPRLTAAGETNALALLDVHNVNSLMYAIEHLAWGLFFGLAAIFMGLAIEGGKIEAWIRWLLIAGGIMSILFIPGVMISSQILIDLGYYAAGILLPITTALLAVRFRKD